MLYKQNEPSGKIFGIIALVGNILALIFQVILIAVIQKYYNKTNDWTDCGNLKGWTITWLVFNYCIIIFEILLTIIGLCQTENSDDE